ncbi:MAG: glycosyltransferase family 2 protein [Candidatus Altiarchaeia archaeon]|jgi:cellulose synthase/poly-beta-1,6-N-acetylglucosamine synthase-like glycosyltransferase
MDYTDYLFLIFAFITLYFDVLFMLIYLRNRETMLLKPAGSNVPSVTIIIPAYNEEDNIASTIRKVKAFDYPKDLLEIIVIDDGSKDGTAENAKKEGARVVTKENEGKAAALNYGTGLAKGDIVGCVDADSYPQEDALLSMVQYFEDERVAAVTSSVLVRNPVNYLERLQEMEYMLIAWGRKLLDYVQSVYVTPGPLSLYRKDALNVVGGFDRKILTEDIEIAWKLHSKGYNVRMDLNARVYTNAPRSFKKWWNQRLRWDIGGIQTVKKHQYAFLKRGYGIFGLFIVPFFLVSMLISLFGLMLFAYIMGMRIADLLTFFYYASKAGINPLSYYSLNMLPNVFTVLGIMGFVFSLVYLITGLQAMGKSIKGKTFFDLLVYLIPYLFLFPILLVHSFWRLAAYRKQRW